ncbi:MAG: hypothetical protein KAI76_09505, partial [Alphaproteobacteria bacterium]|nr:hypothetical protein [Alphaproteobacteria bacterium]
MFFIICEKLEEFRAGYKAKVALLVLREDAPVSELALKYGVHATVIQRWKKESLALYGSPEIFNTDQG